MADVSQTPGNVAKEAGTQQEQFIAGVGGVAAGNSCYLDPTTNTILPGQGTATTTVGRIIAASTAAAGQPVFGYVGGRVNVGGTLVAGTVYGTSAAVAGNIAPVSDFVATNIVKILGQADDTTWLNMEFSGVPIVA